MNEILIPYAKNSADVEAIVAVLDRLAIGEMATYADLSAAISRDIRSHRYLLERALEVMLKQRKVFACVFNEGMKLLSDSEIVDHSLDAFRKIRRMARKSARRLTSVEWQSLTSEDQQRHNLHLSVLGAIVYTATPQHMKILSGPCKNTGPHGLPTAQTLKMLAS